MMSAASLDSPAKSSETCRSFSVEFSQIDRSPRSPARVKVGSDFGPVQRGPVRYTFWNGNDGNGHGQGRRTLNRAISSVG